MNPTEKIRMRVESKLRSLGINPTEDDVDEVMRYLKFSSAPLDRLDRVIEEYVKWRWIK